MDDYDVCFHCGQSGHYARRCPQLRGQAPPLTPQVAPAAKTLLPASHITIEELRRQQAELIQEHAALAAEWPGRIRRDLGWSQSDTGEPDPIVRTPFRKRSGLQPRTESDLRAMALEQVRESRTERLVEPFTPQDVTVGNQT